LYINDQTVFVFMLSTARFHSETKVVPLILWTWLQPDWETDLDPRGFWFLPTSHVVMWPKKMISIAAPWSFFLVQSLQILIPSFPRAIRRAT
jgi:hypothetical protein